MPHGGAEHEDAVGWIFTFRDDKIEAVKAFPSYGDALRAVDAPALHVDFTLRRLNREVNAGRTSVGNPYGRPAGRDFQCTGRQIDRRRINCRGS